MVSKILIGAIGAIAGIGFLFWSASVSFTDENMLLDDIAWTDDTCNNNEIKVSARFVGISKTHLSGKGEEIQCKIRLDRVDLYEEKGTYYCDIGKNLDTFLEADNSRNHVVELCCSSKGLDSGLICKERTIIAKCTDIKI